MYERSTAVKMSSLGYRQIRRWEIKLLLFTLRSEQRRLVWVEMLQVPTCTTVDTPNNQTLHHVYMLYTLCVCLYTCVCVFVC